MATPTVTSKKIKFVIDKYMAYLRYMTLGPKSLSKKQLVELVKEGLISPEDSEKSTITDTYLNAHNDLLTTFSRKAVRDYSIKHIEASAGKYIDKFITKAKTDLTAIIENNLLNMRRKAVTETIKEGLGKKTAKNMAAEIRDKTKDLAKDWDRVVTTELAQATNMGALDAIIENNKGKDPKEIYVYKTGPHDNVTCKWCSKFWFLADNRTPKVYTLTELMAGGSNMGKKVAQWQATIDLTHPNGRHYLLELPLGWGFRAGQLSFIGPNHDEYKAQRS